MTLASKALEPVGGRRRDGLRRRSGSIACSSEQAAAKMAQKAAQYQDTPKGDQQCSNCSLFQKPNACTLVDGEISPARAGASSGSKRQAERRQGSAAQTHKKATRHRPVPIRLKIAGAFERCILKYSPEAFNDHVREGPPQKN
jgi:hypothetical protein